MTTGSYFGFGFLVYSLTSCFFLAVSRGVGRKPAALQLRRYAAAILLAVLPLSLAGESPLTPSYIAALGVGMLWSITHPLLYYVTHRRESTDFWFHMDIAFGIYLVGWLFTLAILGAQVWFVAPLAQILLSLLETALLIIPVCEWLYFALYRLTPDENALGLLQGTYAGEAWEFWESLPFAIRWGAPLLFAAIFSLLLAANFQNFPQLELKVSQLGILLLLAAGLGYYMWKPGGGVFFRTALAELYGDTRTLREETQRYRDSLAARLQTLDVKALRPSPGGKPATYILVIGESATRDYMSAFGYKRDTTPWLRQKVESGDAILFKHAYSCHYMTVPVLTKALTESNQYNGVNFYDACSILDLARKAGFHTYWFSNQSFIGGADTPVTLVAQTADASHWTRHDVRGMQWDERLLDYLPSVKADQDNLVVIHLKGSHFTYFNRYPQEKAFFSGQGKYDPVNNYQDSLLYTDEVLGKIFAYAQKHWNLQAMIYFSDHGSDPDHRRTVALQNRRALRIPLAVYLSPEYKELHPESAKALAANRDKYWTNDLLYELVAGILDLQSSHYDSSQSLASENYDRVPENLFSVDGSVRLADGTLY